MWKILQDSLQFAENSFEKRRLWTIFAVEENEENLNYFLTQDFQDDPIPATIEDLLVKMRPSKENSKRKRT